LGRCDRSLLPAGPRADHQHVEVVHIPSVTTTGRHMEGAEIDSVGPGYRLLVINRLDHEVEGELVGRLALLRDACSWALAYLGGLGDRPVASVAADMAALNRLDFALPGTGQDAASVLALLDDYGSPGTVASGGPRYFGFVTGGALPIAQAA